MNQHLHHVPHLEDGGADDILTIGPRTTTMTMTIWPFFGRLIRKRKENILICHSPSTGWLNNHCLQFSNNVNPILAKVYWPNSI